MSEDMSGQGMTKGEYDKYVADHDRTPTEDPMYNHDEGNPVTRPAAIHHISAGSIDMGTKALEDEKFTAKQINLINEANARSQQEVQE